MVYERDWNRAEQAYERALQLNPSLAIAHHRRALLYAMRGDTDRAIAAAERAQQLEPLWLSPKAATGNFLYYARRYDDSIRLLEEVLALDDRADGARSFLIRNLIAKGNTIAPSWKTTSARSRCPARTHIAHKHSHCPGGDEGARDVRARKE
jgi:tetratricopeptide (TPR) repeat protein